MKRADIIQLKCPVCSRRLIDAGKNIKSVLAPVEEAKESDYYTKCWNCGNIIGISKIN